MERQKAAAALPRIDGGLDIAETAAAALRQRYGRLEPVSHLRRQGLGLLPAIGQPLGDQGLGLFYLAGSHQQGRILLVWRHRERISPDPGAQVVQQLGVAAFCVEHGDADAAQRFFFLWLPAASGASTRSSQAVAASLARLDQGRDIVGLTLAIVRILLGQFLRSCIASGIRLAHASKLIRRSIHVFMPCR